MSRFEREKISKRVLTLSQVFAGLAGIGILIIGLQLFSKTTGIDLFNIDYSLSSLFSDESSRTKVAEDLPVFKPSVIEKPLIQEETDLEAAREKAATFLKNLVQVQAIDPEPNLIVPSNKNNPSQKYSIIDIPSMQSTGDLFNSELALIYKKDISQNGILPMVKNAKYSQWSIGIHLTPGFSFSNIKYTRLGEITTRRIGNTQYGFYQTQKERNSMNKALMKYSFGLDIIYRFKNKLSVQTGLVYCNTGESVLVKEITDDNINRLAAIQNEANPFFNGNPDFEAPKENEPESNIRFANNLAYFEIPLVFSYPIKQINNITDIELQAGASLTRLDYVNAMVYNFDNDGYYLVTGSNPQLYKLYGSNFILGVSASKYITNSIQLFVNPQLKAGLSNMFNSDYNMKQHYYNAGVRLGMKINL